MAEIQAIAMHRDQPKKRRIQLSRFILDFFIPFLFAKQIFINILGGERHVVGAIIEITAVLLIYATAILVMMRESKRSTVFHIPLRALYLWHALLVFYWGSLIFISPNAGTTIQRLMSSMYDGGFTLMIWVPVVFLTSIKDVKRAIRALTIVTAIVGLIGILQWFVPAANFPFFLQGDQSVVLSGTIFGTTRVNGLVGTSLEFALLMAMIFMYFYIKIGETHFSLSSLLMLVITLLGLSFAASRAFWIASALVILIITLFGKRTSRRKWLFIILVVASFAAVPTVQDYFWIPMTTQYPQYVASVNAKILRIKDALSELHSSPIIGTGLGFQTAPAFGNASHKIIADGFWWAVLLEGGIIGFILLFGLLGFVSWVFFTALRNNGSQNSAFTRQLAKCGLAVIGVAVLGNFSNSSLNNQVLNITFYLVIGIVLAGINIDFRERFAQRSKRG